MRTPLAALLVVGAIFLLEGCSSSEDDSPPPTSAPSDDELTGDEPDGENVGEMDDAGNADSGAGDIADVPDEPVPSGEGGAELPVAADPSDVRFVAGTVSSTAGADDETRSTFTYFNAHWSGQIGFSGSFVENDTSKQGVWTGDGSGTSTRRATNGDPVSGLSSNTLFLSADTLVIASDGSMLTEATYRGAEGGKAYARIDERGVTHVLRTGDDAPGIEDGDAFGEDATVQTIAAYDHAADGSMMLAQFRAVATRSYLGYGLWHHDGEQFDWFTVGPGYDGFAYPTTTDGCQVALDVGQRDEFYAIGDDTFAFMGELGGESDSSCSGSAVVVYDDGQLDTVARVGGLVPGTDGVLYQALEIDAAALDGDLVVRADTRRDDEPSNASTGRTAKMLFEPNAGGGFVARLIALDGETLPPDFTTTYSAGTRNTDITTVRVAPGPHVALAYGRTNEPYLYAGPPHGGQPYSDLSNPGASPLRFVASPVSAAPAGYPDTAYFSRLGFFEADVDGGMHFFGVLDDAQVQGTVTEIDRGIWRADSASAVAARLLEGQELEVDGTTFSVSGLGSRTRGFPFGLHLNDDGSLYVLADVQPVGDDGRPGARLGVVLRLPPSAQ